MKLTRSFQTTIIFNAVYAGPQKAGIPLIQPILNLHPTVQNISMIPWKDVTAQSLFNGDPLACTKGGLHNLYGMGLKTFDVATFKKFTADFTNFFYKFPGARNSFFFLEHFPTQAVLAVPDDATAYPHRDISSHL